MMRSPFALLAACVLLLLQCSLVLAVLTPEEQKFLDATSASGARESLLYYTSLDHVAGTPGDYETARYTHAAFERFGLQSEILPFRALLNYPVSRSLSMTSPVQFDAPLSEAVYAQDSTSNSRWSNLTFHGYGASGDVEGELVYVNYGAASDFEYLLSQNISVAGKIAVARYGMVFRGLKVQYAQQYGAIACLIFSDPADDGFKQGPVYADGPWRPETGVQRGGVQFVSRCAGDPGFIERDPDICGFRTDELVPKIPSLPVSYGDMLPFLQQMSGPLPPAAWVGGLNVSYALGPGPARAHLQVDSPYSIATLWNVRAVIPGKHADPEIAAQQIILGNHRDAWVYGSTDPNSGTASMLEIARGLGQLLQSGWAPDRTIILASWDGEEYGLLGSTNYIENRTAELQKYAVAYMNVDVAVTGRRLGVQASASLANVAIDASMDVPDPSSTTGGSLFSSWAAQSGGTYVGILGSGSDYAGFLHHLGVPSMDLRFTGYGAGIYHSVYDSFYWTEKFGDPTFVYHRAMAQLWGLMAMRMAGARVLPLQMSAVATALPSYLATAQQAAITARLPDVNWDPLSQAIDSIAAPAALLECYRLYALSNQSMPAAELTTLNTNLAHMEQSYLITENDGFDGNGLPGRPYFKHILQAPGITTGYGAASLPSLSDAITAVNETAVIEQILLLAKKLDAITADILAITPYTAPGCS